MCSWGNGGKFPGLFTVKQPWKEEVLFRECEIGMSSREYIFTSCHTRSKECTFLPLKWKNYHRLPLKWPFMPRNMFLAYISGDIMCKELTLSSLDYSRKTLCFCVYLNARSYWLCSLTNMEGHVNTLNCVFNQGKVKNSLSKTRLAQIFAHYPSFSACKHLYRHSHILCACLFMFTREKTNDLKISCTCSSFLLLGFCNDLFFDSFQHFVLHVINIHRWQAGIIIMSIWLKLHNDFLFWGKYILWHCVL